MSVVGFIGLGNGGSKLAGTLVRSGAPTMVLDQDLTAMAPLVAYWPVLHQTAFGWR